MQISIHIRVTLAMLHNIRRILKLTRLNQKILRLAIPVFFGMISYTAIMVADTAMVGRLGEIPLAAVGFGGMVYFSIFAFLMGGSMAVQIIVARRFGEKKLQGSWNYINQLAIFIFWYRYFIVLVWISICSQNNGIDR